MSTKAIVRAGLAALVGAAVAFPAGMMFAGREGSGVARERPVSGAAMRKVYSPDVLGDPYFIEQQRLNVEALERTCRETGETCAEAAEARRWLAEHTAD